MRDKDEEGKGRERKNEGEEEGERIDDGGEGVEEKDK